MRSNRRSPSPARRRHFLRIEPLEDRTLLTAGNVFALFAGDVPASGSRQINVSVQGTADFTLSGGKTLVGILTQADGSSLNPAVTQVKQGGTAVAPLNTQADLPGSASSLALV